MGLASNNKLVKLISRLVRQNNELEKKIKEIEKEYDLLSEKYERLKKKSSADDSIDIPTKEKSLKFNMATVLYADIHGFSKLTENMDSTEVMDELDEILRVFDSIVKRHKIEKIKTIGDSYMCAGGIPEKNSTNPIDVVVAAMEMRDFLIDYETKKRGDTRIWELKIGIHTGPVTATISGKNKISYKIKGDTVNTATRIEAISEKDTILMSVMTYELVKEFFSCDYFGKLPVKYKGDIQVFCVNSLMPHLSVNNEGKIPNKAFYTKFGFLLFTDIQEIILDKLEKELPPYSYYHNVKHTVDVVTEVELIGWSEGCSDEEILLLKLAGLFHDVGHTVTYNGHEEAGCKIARETLPKYGISDEDIDKICSLIMATKLPPHPDNLLEMIMCDADLDYLGRSDFIPVSNTLYEELKAHNMVGSINSWNKTQVKFISGHQYFTNTARNLREVNKQLQIERLESIITDED